MKSSEPLSPNRSKHMNQTIKMIGVSAIAGAIAGGAVFGALQYAGRSDASLVKEFYETENAVSISPHSLRKKMSSGETSGFMLVDLRSKEEYGKEHIVTAVNIPAYKDPNTSAYDEVDRIVGAFRELEKNNPGKEIIMYCYSMPCMTSRKIGKMLAENDIYAKHLNIGWNEWRYYWNLWNHDSEPSTNALDYVVSGSEPGAPKTGTLPPPCGEGEFGC